MRLPEISSLIDLANLAASQSNGSPDINRSSNILLNALTMLPADTRAGNIAPVSLAMQHLGLLSIIPEELTMRQIATPLQPSVEQLQRFRMGPSQQQNWVRLDALVFLMCLGATGDVADKLDVCYCTLIDRNGLTLPRLLAMLPGLRCTAAAAQLILRHDTPQSLAAQLSNTGAEAEWQQRQQARQQGGAAEIAPAASLTRQLSEQLEAQQQHQQLQQLRQQLHVHSRNEALTSTAGQLARAVQSNVAAASARVLVHCSVCFLLTTMVALGDAALVAGLHAGAGLALSVSFGIAVGANLGLVVVLFGGLLLVRCLNRSSDRAMSEAMTGPQVQQLDELLRSLQTAVTLLKQSEQQPPGAQQPAAQRGNNTAAGGGSGTPLPRSSSSMAYRDVEEGSAAAAAAGADAAAGNFLMSDKIRTVWSTVGRMAGFLPPAVEGLGPQESLQSPHALPSTLVMHSNFSTASGEASPHPALVYV
ncbi:hypothetical protein OEZ86_004888 [Tetradesmus obliquus]|nr:hypothetical protein OEZ86_004888 [Tetradesmus obliquus]